MQRIGDGTHERPFENALRLFASPRGEVSAQKHVKKTARLLRRAAFIAL